MSILPYSCYTARSQDKCYFYNDNSSFRNMLTTISTKSSDHRSSFNIRLNTTSDIKASCDKYWELFSASLQQHLSHSLPLSLPSSLPLVLHKFLINIIINYYIFNICRYSWNSKNGYRRKAWLSSGRWSPRCSAATGPASPSGSIRPTAPQCAR